MFGNDPMALDEFRGLLRSLSSNSRAGELNETGLSVVAGNVISYSYATALVRVSTATCWITVSPFKMSCFQAVRSRSIDCCARLTFHWAPSALESSAVQL